MEGSTPVIESKTMPEEPALPVPSGLALARNQTVALALQGLMPTSLGEAYTLATYLAKSKAIPYSLRNQPETVLTVILAGLEIGLTPIRAVNNLTNIKGNLGMKADLQLAIVRRSGLLAFYDEGFELRNVTDTDLQVRAKDGAKVLALVKAVPDGKPYGWASSQRKDDPQLVTRTFTWADAEMIEIREEADETNPDIGGGKSKGKLSEKFNYRSFPGDMYPKRARSRVLQITHSDVLAGLPSAEALEGGQVIDLGPGDYAVAGGEDAEGILGEMRQIDSEATAGIEAAFKHLEYSSGRQLQVLTKWKGDPQGLWRTLRDEYSRRQGKPQAAPPKAKPAAQAPVVKDGTTAADKPAETKPAPATVAPQTTAAPTVQAAAETKPADPLFATSFEGPDGRKIPATEPIELATPTEPATTKKPSVSDLAAKFRKSITF